VKELAKLRLQVLVVDKTSNIANPKRKLQALEKDYKVTRSEWVGLA
jgi:hypothetical protein